MKIIHITQSFLPGGGGIENSVHNIVQAIKKENIGSQEIVSVYRNYDNDTSFDLQYNVAINRSKSYLFNKSKSLFKNFNSLAGGNKKINTLGKLSMIVVGITTFFSLFVLCLKRVIVSREKDTVLHCYSISAVFVAVLIRKILLFKTIHILFGVHFVYKKSNFKSMDYLIKKSISNVDHFVCVSNVVRESMVKNFNIKSEHVKVSYNWMSSDEYLTLNSGNNINFKTTPIEILMVCRIVPEKGINDIINFAKFLDKSKLSSDFKITVIGDSLHPMKKYLEKESEKINSLKYLGRIEKPKLWKYFKKSHIFLMLSTWEEAFGRTIIESYASGVPVVGLSRGAVSEILNKFPIHGIIRTADSNEIMECIQNVISSINKCGHDKFVALSDMAIGEHFTDKNVKIYIDSYLNK